MAARAPLTADGLRALLRSHEQWVESGGKEGERANLEHADLREADLSGANLKRGRLRGACFDGADVRDTSFRDADLTNADLGNAHGLAFQNLAGAVLTGADLPKSVDTAVYLNRLSDLSGSARTTFNTLLIVCGYSALTILTTTHDDILRNASASPIPFTETEAPIFWFFVLTPGLVVTFYVFFVLGLLRLWSSIAQMPAILPDGSNLASIPSTWMLADIARSSFYQLRRLPEESAVKYNSLSLFVSLFIPIAVLFLFWWKYMPLRSPLSTFYHIIVIVIAIVAAIGLIRSMIVHFGGAMIPSIGSVCVVLVVGISIFSSWLFWGSHDRWSCVEDVTDYLQCKIGDDPKVCPTDVYDYLACKISSPFSILTGAVKLSTPPANWTEPINIRDEEWSEFDIAINNKINSLFATIDGVELVGFNLESADMRYAFLVKARVDSNLNDANLSFADMRLAMFNPIDAIGANFSNADLRRARMIGVNLENASFWGADLRGANLSFATLIGAKLYKADLTGTRLKEAKMIGAELPAVKLKRARLEGVDLTGATLSSTDLGDATLVGAVLTDAKLAGAVMNGADLQCATLDKAVLTDAMLYDAKLANASLKGADFTGARLDGTDLTGAHLDDATRITQEQVDSACADIQPTLPERLSKGKNLPSCPPTVSDRRLDRCPGS